MDIYNILRIVIHYSLHVFFPVLVALIFFRDEWKTAWLIMLATMLVDLDHLFANPIFDSSRCSIGFHPLHSYYAIIIYILMMFIPNTKVRIIAIGLLFHMLADFQDCFWIFFR